MAMNIFAGTYLKVEVSATAGSTVATDFAEVPEVADFTVSGLESTVIDVVTYNSKWNRTLLGTMKVPQIELKVNNLQDDEVQEKLATWALSQKRFQIKISYFEDDTYTDGFYVVYNVFSSTNTLAGSKDEVVTRTFTLVADSGPVKEGLLPIAP
ncbi:hypothetical protein [Klebsiella michiganensis]|uniref:hypothetical protein n=1 Tax=Klebsiella michiganensis TaxID=1134687 RepID=UPI001D0EDE3D|nr:hypothetical protein [Klebsiella michiganensis]